MNLRFCPISAGQAARQSSHTNSAFNASQNADRSRSVIDSDLFQDRLAKLTEHAAHVDTVIGAIAQHSLRFAPVAQWLQR